MGGKNIIRRLRLGSGLVLFVFVTTHFLNHALGLISLDAMEAGRNWFMVLWRNLPATVLLYAALVIHAALAIWALYSRRNLRMHAWEATQLVLGFLIPLVLLAHIVGTRGMWELFGVDDRYVVELVIFWELRPERAVLQSLLILVAWTHGCIGLHFWLRLRPGYPTVAPVLLSVAVLIPVLALLGFVAGAREAVALWADPAFQETLKAEVNWATDEQAAIPQRVGELSFIAVPLLIAIVLGARFVRGQLARRRGIVRLTYPGPRVVEIPPGLSILEASRSAGLPHASVCGGRGRCSTCRIRVGNGLETLAPANDAESKVLRRVGAAPNVRLACQTRPTVDLEITPLVPPGASPRAAHPRAAHLQGRDQELAILFADLRSFTQFAEQKLPYDVVYVLNRYFNYMGQAIEKSGGHLDKFIGDGVMALFGIENGPERGCQQALSAARAMSDALRDLNESMAGDLPEPLRIGIGIHAGTVIIGEMGYAQATSVTAIGDAVNTASRLESMTKEHGAQLIVSEGVARRAGVDLSGFEAHEVTVRGRQEPLVIRVIADAGELAGIPALSGKADRAGRAERSPSAEVESEASPSGSA